MNRTWKLLLTLALSLCACGTNPQPLFTPESGDEIETLTPATQTLTSIPTFTSTSTLTITTTPITPTLPDTSTPGATMTPKPTEEETVPPTGEQPGVQLNGRVISPSGEGIEGVQIYYAFAAYSGNLFDTTDAQGQYEGFIYIPHDETVRVWAETAGYDFKPGSGNKSWLNGEFAWRNYGNYEFVELNFIGTPQ